MVLAPWDPDCSRLVPWWLYEHLVANGGRPDPSWSRDLLKVQCGENHLAMLEPLDSNAPREYRPYCCLVRTVIFYRDSLAWETPHSRVDHEARAFPSVHFTEHCGRLFEVTFGHVLFVFERWHLEWSCWANTELARHFNGVGCGDGCRPCRVLRPEPGRLTDDRQTAAVDISNATREYVERVTRDLGAGI